VRRRGSPLKREKRERREIEKGGRRKGLHRLTLSISHANLSSVSYSRRLVWRDLVTPTAVARLVETQRNAAGSLIALEQLTRLSHTRCQRGATLRSGTWVAFKITPYALT
jgi:hypothetical protein